MHDAICLLFAACFKSGNPTTLEGDTFFKLNCVKCNDPEDETVERLRLTWYIPGVPKERNARFSLLWYSKKIIFWKEWYKDHWNWSSSFYSRVISQNIVIVNFLFILVTFQLGIMVFLTSIHCCLEAHWSVQTKQRELMDCYARRK